MCCYFMERETNWVAVLCLLAIPLSRPEVGAVEAAPLEKVGLDENISPSACKVGSVRSELRPGSLDEGYTSV